MPAKGGEKSPEVFGDGRPFGDPSWYQRWHTPYYKESHERLRAEVREWVSTVIEPNCFEWVVPSRFRFNRRTRKRTCPRKSIDKWVNGDTWLAYLVSITPRIIHLYVINPFPRKNGIISTNSSSPTNFPDVDPVESYGISLVVTVLVSHHLSNSVGECQKTSRPRHHRREKSYLFMYHRTRCWIRCCKSRDRS